MQYASPGVSSRSIVLKLRLDLGMIPCHTEDTKNLHRDERIDSAEDMQSLLPVGVLEPAAKSLGLDGGNRD